MAEVPDGFERHFRRSGLTEPWEPLYSRRVGGALQIGLLASGVHANSRGFVHGGLIASLADNAMGLSCVEQSESLTGLVTVSLSLDYLASARTGQWLQVEPRVLKLGRTLCFADALVTSDGGPVARASASFSVPRP